MQEKIELSNQVFNKLIVGLDKVANAVSSTLGPKGRNVYLYSQDPMQTRTTNDGVSIANNIVLKDLKEDYQWQIIQQYKQKPLNGDLKVKIKTYHDNKRKNDWDIFINYQWTQ